MARADEAASLPVVQLQAGGIDGLRHAPSMRWRQIMLAAGLLAEVPEADDPADPRAWIAALQELLAELVFLEEHRDGLVWQDDRFFIHDAPWWVWVGLVCQPFLAFTLGGAQTDDVHQVVIFLLIYVIPGTLAVCFGAVAAARVRRLRAARKAELRSIKARIKQIRVELFEGIQRTLGRNFIARAGSRLLVCVPAMGEASGPALTRLAETVESLKRSPPEGWVDLEVSGSTDG